MALGRQGLLIQMSGVHASSVAPASSVTFTLPPSDAYPRDLYHARRGMIGGSWARGWIGFSQSGTDYTADVQHGGSSADATADVASRSGSTRIAVTLLDSLLRPRGLAMSLRGGRFGVTKLGLFEPTEVDAVIDESSVALRSLEDPSSIPTTQQLRATGGLDLVVLQAGLDPSTGEHVYAQTLPARDPGSRFRRGDIEENITATGLLDPAWGVGGSGWLGQARELHSVQRAKWLNQRHFLIRTTLHRIAGENLWPGSRVSFTSERVYTAAGELGMSSALGHVLSVTARPREQEYDVEIIVYAGQLRLSLFAPIGKVESFSGTTVQLAVDADFLDHGEGFDANRFVRPSWLALETAATVCLLEYDRRDWTLHSGDTSTVAGVSGHVVTLDSAFTGFHAHRDYYLVLVGFDDQVEGSWPRASCLPYVLDTLQFGSGPTDGWPFLDG